MDSAAVLKLITAHSPPDPLPDMPIDPAQITSGNPIARGSILTQSTDKTISSGLWTCDPGEFDWEYTWDEFIYILEGHVTISEQGREPYALGPGDLGHFRLGLKSHWKVSQAVRKFFVIQTPEPLDF